MTQTMRERLIAAGDAAIASLPVTDPANPGGELDQLRRREAVRSVLDAILAELREPDEGVDQAGVRALWDHVPLTDAYDAPVRAVFNAMIDHVRAGK